MKKFRRRSRADNGGMSNTVSMLIFVLVVVFFLFLVLETIRQIQVYSDLKDFASELVLVVKDTGKTADPAITQRYDELAASFGLTPRLTISAKAYYNASRKTVQYGNPITIRLDYESRFLGVGSFSLPFPMQIIRTTQSMQYWK